jgi:hypothetical protein
MLALAEWERLTCNGCGGWLPETTALENSDNYAPPKPIRCHCCEALAISQELRSSKERPQVQRWPMPQLKAR